MIKQIKKEIIDSLPYSAIEELIRTRLYIDKITSENIAIVTSSPTHPGDSILCQFNDNSSDYVFVINYLTYDRESKKIIYRIYMRPASVENLAGYENDMTLEKIPAIFGLWIESITKMNRIKVDYYNPHNSFYDQQFENFFVNDEEDAAYNPFEIERQELIYNFLKYAKTKVDDRNDISIENALPTFR